MGHMHTDLVGTTGLQLTAHMGIAPITGNDFPMGHRIAGVPFGHAHFLAVRGMAANGRIHRTGIRFQIAANNTFIGARHGVILQLGCQHHMGQIVFCHRQQTGGILIDPVDDTRTQLSVDTGQIIPHGIHQAID